MSSTHAANKKCLLESPWTRARIRKSRIGSSTSAFFRCLLSGAVRREIGLLRSASGGLVDWPSGCRRRKTRRLSLRSERPIVIRAAPDPGHIAWVFARLSWVFAGHLVLPGSRGRLLSPHYLALALTVGMLHPVQALSHHVGRLHLVGV